MNITPITKKYTNPYNTFSVSFGNKSGVSKNSENSFYCSKTIVKNTLNEFSNSRGNYLADIDLLDIYIPNKTSITKKNEIKNKKQTIVNNTPIKKDKSNIQFLADMELCDAYELPKASNKKGNNLQIPFDGAYPQYLIDQDAVEQYEATSNGIQDIANSTYCSFSGFEKAEETVVNKLVNFVKRCLPL